MRPGDLVAYILSTPTRRAVRDDTVAALAATDWGEQPVVVLDQHRYDEVRPRMLDNARTLLLRALARPAELILFLEDDVDFNTHLRHNLLQWPPLVDWSPGGHFFASLYNPDIGSLDPAADGETWRRVDPDLVYGSQALLVAAATARWILERWDDGRGLHDVRMPLLAAQVTPILYHRPSLVQHRQVPSAWGGVAHAAVDFSATWRAPG